MSQFKRSSSSSVSCITDTRAEEKSSGVKSVKIGSGVKSVKIESGGGVKWLNNVCRNLKIDYGTDILELLSLLMIISKVLKEPIKEAELIEVLSERGERRGVTDIIREMVGRMVGVSHTDITFEYVSRICNIDRGLVRQIMCVFKLNITIDVSSRVKREVNDTGVLWDICESMIYRLITIIRTEGDHKPSEDISQKRLRVMTMNHREMRLYNKLLNKLKQSLEIYLPEDVCQSDRELYDINVFCNGWVSNGALNYLQNMNHMFSNICIKTFV
jgi:hypothetical protein